MIIILSLVLLTSACFSSKVDSSPAPQTKSRTNFKAADLQRLRWIEGTWRGTGDVDKPFFERYRFDNETTLAIDSYEDETLTKITDTTLYELKDGEFGGGTEGYRWIATSIDDHSITFTPVTKARNSFRFERETKDSWKATLNWPATADKPARQRVYRMERWPLK